MFAVLKAAKELKTREQADFMYDLIGVACAPHADQKYIDELRSTYRTIRDNSVPELKPADTVIWTEQGSPVIPFDQATKIMAEQMKIKKRLESGY